jgi:lycopene cyclase domain-containing protein
MSRLLDLAPRWHYLGVLVACVLCTLPLELVLGARVYRQPRRLALTLFAVGVPFLLLDWAAVEAGLWSFSPRHTLGARLAGRIPVEEVLFFVVIPLCALLTHGAVSTLLGRRRRAEVPAPPPPVAERTPVAAGIAEDR